MKLSKCMIDHLERFGEYDTPKYRYYIGTDKGKEYVKRYPVRRFGNYIKTTGKTEKMLESGKERHGLYFNVSDSLYYVHWCSYHYTVYQSVQFHSCNWF